MGLGEMGKAPRSIQRRMDRGKSREERKRYQRLNISCLWWVLLLTWGFPLKAFQHSNMKHMLEMGVGERTRVIIGMVGVTESWGSAVCVTGISSRSVVLYESLRRVYRRLSTLVLIHVLFIVAVVQTHRVNLLKGHIVFFTRCSSLHALVLWFFIKHVFILYTDGNADLLGGGSPNQKGTNYSFSEQGKNYISDKASWKIQLSKNICLESLHTALDAFDWQPTTSDIWHLQCRKGHRGEFKVAECQQSGNTIQDAMLPGPSVCPSDTLPCQRLWHSIICRLQIYTAIEVRLYVEHPNWQNVK